MKLVIRKSLPAPRPRQQGVAAIELAIVLPLFLIALAPLVLYARYQWHYTVAQKAAQDAARYMSTVSAMEMKSKVLTGYAKAVAIQIAKTEVAELSPGEDISDADVLCDTHTCGSTAGTVPSTVNVYISFHLTDTFFGIYLGPYGVSVEANVTMRYVGK